MSFDIIKISFIFIKKLLVSYKIMTRQLNEMGKSDANSYASERKFNPNNFKKVQKKLACSK